MFQLFRSLFSRTANLGGVSPDFQNKLAVTGTATPVAVNTGYALVYGIPYSNSASVNVTVATPASLTRIDYIVLRASWAAKTVRITRIAGTEGGAAPALVQTAGTTWDIPLATVSITTGGVITVTDAREWLGGIGDLTIDSTKLANDAVTYAKMQNVSATDRFLGRDTAAAGDVEEITPAAARTILNVADGADVTGAAIAAAAAKTTPVDADTFPLSDSAASNAIKKVTLANLKIALGNVLGTIAVPVLHDATTIGAAVTLISTPFGGWFDVNKIPAAATVKLFLYINANTSSSVVIDLETRTAADSPTVISAVLSPGSGTGIFLSSDIKSSIGSTARMFRVTGSKASAGSVTLSSAQLVIEW